MVAAACRTALFALAVAGCTGIVADARTFEGTRWRVTAINGVRAPPPSVWTYSVWFSGGYMRGVICNRFDAPFIVIRDVVQLNGFMSTERGCSNPEARFEEWAFAILHQPMRMNWHSARRLTLGNRNGSIQLELEA